MSRDHKHGTLHVYVYGVGVEKSLLDSSFFNSWHLASIFFLFAQSHQFTIDQTWSVCLRVCVRACVRECVRVCVCVYVCLSVCVSLASDSSETIHVIIVKLGTVTGSDMIMHHVSFFL